MAHHVAVVTWDRFDAAFTDNRYSRAHRWTFDGGATIPASYEDHAVGTMSPDASGRLAMTRVALRPSIAFSGSSRPTDEDIAAMHDEAHHSCFLANSVRTDVVVEHERTTTSRLTKPKAAARSG